MMPTDTSREGIEALIDDLSNPHSVPLVRDALAALLDERDVAIKDRKYKTEQKVKLSERIRDLEAEKHAAEQAAVGWRKEAERAETERNRLAAMLADETKRADDNYDDVHRWRSRARALAAKLDAVSTLDDFAAVFRIAWLKADREGREGERVRSGLKAVSAAILADTNEGDEQ